VISAICSEVVAVRPRLHHGLAVDSFRKICTRLLESGMTEREVRMLVADNPARLLGLA
jgi:hypothetical protein